MCYVCVNELINGILKGCDASVIIQSTGSNKAEKDSKDDLSLAGDGFDTVIKAKEAVDAIPQCRNKVSCADILAMATRDVIVLVIINNNYIFKLNLIMHEVN